MKPSGDPYLELLKKTLCASLYDESAWWVVQQPQRCPLSRPGAFLKSVCQRAIVGWLRRRRFLLVRAKPYDSAARDQGLDWPCFGYTMVGMRRLDNVQACVEDVLARNVPGDLVETGVWRGGCAMLMAAILKQHRVTDRLVWCADCFEGLPAPDQEHNRIDRDADYSGLGVLVVSLEQVQANFRRFDLLDDRVRFLKGWFAQTLPTAPIQRIAVLRLDGDLYESTMDALVPLYPKVSPGGYVIVDDYHSWRGCRRAINEYRHRHGITSELIRIDEHACYWRVEPASQDAVNSSGSPAGS